MTYVPQIRMRARAAQCGLGERLVDGRYYLLRLKFVETNAAAAYVAFAAFEGARHARQGILHDPDIALVLYGAARLPRSGKAANRPWAPDSRVHGSEQRDGRASGCSGEMGRRCVWSDIYAGVRKQL